ncbi:hypothetical protein [Fusobacterium sp. CAG:649]|uniref:hypothetical protein n=1 Tax=Fusobacterium sp. CAG:649 TaxID=1262900 RepID=UPI00033D1C5F|nr:hypothetical protein [Fusobacterium sp. CAG:649]CDA08290.1 uncharacterized protein BN748_00148 [Fusobacterium sp. CAG:649]
MKKVLGSVLFLFALSSLAYAEDDAAKVLDKMRDKIEKEDAEKAKAAEAQAATSTNEVGTPVVTSTAASTMSAEDQKDAMDILDRMRAKIEKEEAEKAKLVAEAKPKTEAEKLELTRKKAMDKLDFYERVVRSVAREENEVSDYYEIMGEKKQRSTVMLGTAPEEAPAEQQQVEQNAAPTEAQATPETKVEEAK